MSQPETQQPKTLVMKFGGTSIGTPETIIQVANIVRQTRHEWPRMVVVSSALAGVTNLLLESASYASQGDTRLFTQASHQFYSMHNDIIQALLPDPTHQAQVRHEVNLLINEFTNLCRAISVLGKATPRALDTIASLGERMSVRLLAAILQSQGIPAPFVEATRLIVSDDNFQNAHPDLESTAQLARQNLEPLLFAGQVPIVTGFIAATANGITTTLGRGGSDLTATLIGAVLQANEIWIWTDSDGISTADPRLVPDACTIEKLSYQEVAELSFLGAKILYPKAIQPAVDASIPIRICNLANPAHPGTYIVPQDQARENGGNIRAITSFRKQRLVTLQGNGMLGLPSIVARALTAVAAANTNIPVIIQTTSEQTFCFAVAEEAVTQTIAILENEFAAELARRDIERIWATGEVGIVTVVGDSMRSTPGIAGRVFQVLGEHNVNILAIAQGTPEIAISIVVDAAHAEEAILALHKLILCNR